LFRGVVWFGWVLIAVCVVLMIAVPSARPGWRFWTERALIGAVVGVLVGLLIRAVVPVETRLGAMRRLSAVGRRQR
jgi:hypothetical protein